MKRLGRVLICMQWCQRLDADVSDVIGRMFPINR